MTNKTCKMNNWQQEHDSMLMSICEDIGQLERGTRYIPEVVQDQTTITVTSIVIVVLTILSISHFIIRKKFSNLTEQVGNALRTVTP